MNPIDPVKAVPDETPKGMAPPYVDEDPNEALVEDGLDIAEDEAREAAADDFEANARASGEEDELAGEEDFEDEKPSSLPPEVAAIHEEGDPDEEASGD